MTSAGHDSNAIPPLPKKWDRCHAYNSRKRRYCRQMPVPARPSPGRCDVRNRPRYCGNHRHLLDESLSRHGNDLERGVENSGDGVGKWKTMCSYAQAINLDGERNKKDRGRRVPCPIDPSHLIFESAIAKHILVCPAAKQKREVSGKDYYCEGINLGGFGNLGAVSSDSDGVNPTEYLEQARALAFAVLRVFHHLFLTPRSECGALDLNGNYCALSNRQLQSITEKEIYNALPEMDLSEAEEGTSDVTSGQSSIDVHRSGKHEVKQGKESSIKRHPGRLTHAIAKHRIKAGGVRHLHQIASILGHVRRNGLITTIKPGTENSPLIVEMGAGRGMTGLVVAGATGASLGGTDPSAKVKLYLIERAGTRGKAETKIRMAEEGNNANDDCLRIDRVDVTRVKCDLAHVDMSRALPSQLRSTSSRTVVIAKHLCGAGTDIALKSLHNIGEIDGCIMATCCHGLCSWSEYVGRDILLRLFCGEVGGLPTFGEDEFNLLKRWTSASVLEDGHIAVGNVLADDNKMKEEHHDVIAEDEKGRYANIFIIARESGLACGGRGVGRCVQRLIDYGRCSYMRNNLLFSDSSSNDKRFEVSMLHYVPRHITPQNALIVASK